MFLTATTQSLELDLNGVVATNQLPVTVSFVDVSQTTFAVTGYGSPTTQSNGTTAVTICAAPEASTTRQIKDLTIKNSDTAAVLLWVQLNDNGTLREKWKGTLAVNDTLQYTDTGGWRVLDANGNLKQAPSSIAIASGKTLTISESMTLTAGAANLTFTLPGTSATIARTDAAQTFSGLQTFNAGISIPTGQNVTGAGTAQVTGFASVSATTLTGTLSTAAQPNVTSLGATIANTNSGSDSDYGMVKFLKSGLNSGEEIAIALGRVYDTSNVFLAYHYDSIAANAYAYLFHQGDSVLTGLKLQKGGNVTIGGAINSDSTTDSTSTTTGSIQTDGGLGVAKRIVGGSTIRTGGYTVATLPAGTQGDETFVTDATAPTFLGALTGGGAVVTPVFYNGAAWVSF